MRELLNILLVQKRKKQFSFLLQKKMPNIKKKSVVKVKRNIVLLKRNKFEKIKKSFFKY